MKAGDTPSQVATRFIAPPHGWRDVMRLAGSRNPRRLPVGRVLAIPVDWLRGEPGQATLATYRGTVSITIAGRTARPAAGTALGEGAELATAADSFATLVLPNGSRVALPSQSRIRIARLRKLLINGAIQYRFELKSGRVDPRVTPITDPSGRYNITTPVSMTAVRGTDFGVSYDPAQKSAGTAVFDGKVAVAPPDGREPLLVPKDFGATTTADGRSEKVQLLPAPDLTNPDKRQRDDLVTFDLTPVPGATSYHILLATDAGFVDSFREQTSASPHFEIGDVPDGNEFVRVSAAPANGLEGQRQTYSFIRRLASIHGAAAAVPDGFQFKWFGAGQGKRHYRLEIFRDKPEGTPIVDETGLTVEEVTIKGLTPGTYYWRVATVQNDPDGMSENWTDPERLMIAASSGG